MTADRAGRDARRIEKDERRGLGRPPLTRIGFDEFGFDVHAREIFADQREAIGRDVDGGHVRTG